MKAPEQSSQNIASSAGWSGCATSINGLPSLGHFMTFPLKKMATFSDTSELANCRMKNQLQAQIVFRKRTHRVRLTDNLGATVPFSQS
jgi:hypothetical protein